MEATGREEVSYEESLSYVASVSSRHGLELSDAEVQHIADKLQQRWKGWYDQNAEETLAIIQERLKLSTGELKKVVLGQPTLLGYSWENNMEPTLASLEKRLQLSASELKKVVLGMPSLLGMSWQDNMEPQIAMMEDAVGNAEASAVVKALIISNPTVLGHSNEKRIRPRLEELKEMSQDVDGSMLRAVCKYTAAKWEKKIAALRFSKTLVQ